VRDNSADTDTEAHAFAYSYDVNGNMTGINDTSSGARADDYQVAYTGLNQVATVKEALAGQETATTSSSYDVLGQPLTVAHPDQRSEYTYDLALDPRGPLTSLSVDDLNDSAAAKVTRYTYDALGRQATQTKANGNVVTNGYFLDGALKSLRGWFLMTARSTSLGELLGRERLLSEDDMHVYYKTRGEVSNGDEAELWFEFDGLVPSRQVTNVGERWLCSLDDWNDRVGMLLTDQPLQPGEFLDEETISADEFEAAWVRALEMRGAR
jgi:YD repeat-containing protein